MFLFLLIFSLVIVIFLLLQFYIIYRDTKKPKFRAINSIDNKGIEIYTENIDIDKLKTDVNNAMNALYAGKIKKHLLHNDAPEYDSRLARKIYLDFLCNSKLSGQLLNLEDKKYYG